MSQLQIWKPHLESDTKNETAGAVYEIAYTIFEMLNKKEQSNASKLLSTINKMKPNEDLAESIKKVVEFNHGSMLAKTNFEI